MKAKPNSEKVRGILGEDEEQFAPEQEKALSRACDSTIILIRRSF